MRQIKNRKAFTIIEMVIVIAVIAILATVMVPTISGIIQKANHSADTQFVASLNIQLAMWQVDNGQIENEADLRDAINEYYGTEDTPDYYATLAPKSGKQGYHYWWDVANKQVVLAKYDDLTGASGRRDIVEPTFSPASPRSLIIETPEGKKNYFLMDQAGSELADQLKALDNVASDVDLQLVIGNLSALEDDTGAAALMAGRLNSIAVANKNGLFGAGTPGYVYIPMTETVLGTSNGGLDLSNVVEIRLPDSIVNLATNSLAGLNPYEGDGTNVEIGNATVIYLNTTEDKLEEVVSASATNGVIELPNGTRYAFVGGVLTKLGDPNTKIETEYSTKLVSFQVSGPNETGKAVYLYMSGNSGTIYYTPEHTGSITLSVGDFKDENGDESPRGVTWTGVGDAVAAADGSITLTLDQLKAASTITVSSTDDVAYSISVQAVYLESLDAKFNNQDGTPSNVDGIVHRGYSDLEYKSDSTWTISSSVFIENDVAYVAIDDGVEITIGGAGAAYLDLSGNTLKIKGNPTGSFSATVTVTTKAKDADGNTKSVVLDLSFKAASSTFMRADGVNTQDTYGFPFVIGTKNVDNTSATFELGTLFTKLSGEPNKNTITVQLVNNTNTTTLAHDFSDSNWEKWTITIPDTTASANSYYIRIKDGDESCDLPVQIVKGAYNVASADDWNEVANSSSIVLLQNIAIPDVSISAMSNGAGYYSKNIGSGSIYGNMKKIEFGTFLIKVKSNNYFLRMGNNSHLYNLIIDGPAYTTRQMTQNTNGYFVSGIETTSTSYIDNCYISGFRVAIYAQGNTEISDSVINGGAVANIYIHGSLTLKLTNVEAYQGVHGSAKIGGGILVDHGNSAGTTATLNVSNFMQNTYYTESELKEFCNSVQSNVWSSIKSKVSGLKTGDYYHVGVIASCENKSYPVNVTVINGYTSGTYEFNIIVYRKFVAYGNGSNLPTRVDSYSIDDDFIYSKYTEEYKNSLN